MLVLSTLFHVDPLSLIMMILVGFVGANIVSFSYRYLCGDGSRGSFYRNLMALLLSVMIMVCADHILLLWFSWACSNIFLTRLMCHKPGWEAARQSSILAFKYLGLGMFLLGVSFALLYTATGQTSVQKILQASIDPLLGGVSACLILIAGMIQSAIWPFNTWLTSSANSPTPVSAIMHAGLVNGGGFMLARFATLFLSQPYMLDLVFIAGLFTALLGILWKLLQSDVKRMLACSTMGQMGFMFAQCGLGLFPMAIAHLCWHGLFKAYLFLASGGAGQERRYDVAYSPKLHHFILALLCSGLGTYITSLTIGLTFSAVDTSIFLFLLVMITGSQLALNLLARRPFARLPLILVVMVVAGAIYGLSFNLIDQTLEPLDIFKPQPLNGLHIFAIIMLIIAWLTMVFGHWRTKGDYPGWVMRFYVRMLNASQPHPRTVTANRNQYHF